MAEDHLRSRGPTGLLSATDGGLNTCRQLARAEWFGDVIVSSEFKQQDLVGNLGNCTQYQHGRIGRPGLDTLADVSAGHARKHQIQDDGCRPQSLARGQTLRPIAGYVNRVTLRGELAVKRLLYSRIILRSE